MHRRWAVPGCSAKTDSCIAVGPSLGALPKRIHASPLGRPWVLYQNGFMHRRCRPWVLYQNGFMHRCWAVPGCSNKTGFMHHRWAVPGCSTKTGSCIAVVVPGCSTKTGSCIAVGPSLGALTKLGSCITVGPSLGALPKRIHASLLGRPWVLYQNGFMHRCWAVPGCSTKTDSCKFWCVPTRTPCFRIYGSTLAWEPMLIRDVEDRGNLNSAGQPACKISGWSPFRLPTPTHQVK